MKASLLMLLIVAIVSGQQSETHIDFFNDWSLKEGYNVSRVEQIVDVTYPYSLITSNQSQWSQFPDMKIMINLDIGQYVRIRYNIICYSTVNSYLVTRVKIDGVENRFFRCISQNTIYHHNAGDKEVYLEKGTTRSLWSIEEMRRSSTITRAIGLVPSSVLHTVKSINDLPPNHLIQDNMDSI
jgi:hypothetical protein